MMDFVWITLFVGAVVGVIVALLAVDRAFFGPKQIDQDDVPF
jgi:hypothetical protein